MNDITIKQLEPRMLDLRRASTLIYSRAKNYQAFFLIVTLLLPVIGALAASFKPEIRPYVAAVALAFGFADVLLFDRWHKARLKTGAKLGEDFDCTVLNMDWNKFLVGSKIDPEDVFADAFKKLSKDQEDRLTNWYPVIVKELPIHLARLVCQRSNLRYDTSIRKTYRLMLISAVLVVIGVATAYSLSIDPTMTSFVLSVLAPVSPIVTWALREFIRQSDTVNLTEGLKNEIEKLWNLSLSGTSPTVLSTSSRELQDAIYNHRVSSPLIFDWIYNLQRNGLEAQMNNGAEYWVRELQSSPSLLRNPS